MTRRIKINVNHFNRRSGLLTAVRGRNLCAALCLLPGLLVQVAVAQSIETSWFEIELLAFSRDNSRALLEQFPAKVSKVDTKGSLDLLSPLYQPDLTAILLNAPACSASGLMLEPMLSLSTDEVSAPLFATDEASLAAFQFQQTQFKLPLPTTGQPLPELCAIDDTVSVRQPLQPILAGAVQIKLPPPLMLPLTPQGQEQHQPQPYLAPAASLQLKDLAYQLQHRGGHQLLLHTAWRQPLAGKRQARPYRWYAGTNFGAQFDYFGRFKADLTDSPVASEDKLIQQISALEKSLTSNPATPLAELQPVVNQQSEEPVWQLDGWIRVYSERMLFAETNFNLRRISADGTKLSTYHSKDHSRLLIGEVHYLDHPHLGLVLQIRRFTPPLLPMDENGTPQ